MAFEITLTDDSTERVDGADSYTLEGPLTTFFGNDRPRPLDSWSIKVASYRTDRIVRIRRLTGNLAPRARDDAAPSPAPAGH